MTREEVFEHVKETHNKVDAEQCEPLGGLPCLDHDQRASGDPGFLEQLPPTGLLQPRSGKERGGT